MSLQWEDPNELKYPETPDTEIYKQPPLWMRWACFLITTGAWVAVIILAIWKLRGE